MILTEKDNIKNENIAIDTSDNLHNGYINTLRQSLIEDTLVIFVGAGISYLTNNKAYPLWGTIIDILKQELSSSKETDYLKVAQLYNLEHGKIKTKKIIQNCFPKVDKPEKIQELIFGLNPHYVITTNWDCLLDNEIIEKSLGYDIIASDTELVESTLKNKMIKMHGDFNHDNYVFTEDDYLNYSDKFPLIENYVRSIMATNTVLFIGYSFSDIDLKQIVNWLQYHSKDRPPAFLVVSSERYNSSEEKYLNKFGITVLELENKENHDESLLHLLERIKTDEPSEYYDAIDYILTKLKPLNSHHSILQSQITNVLTNAIIIYDKYSRAILQFTWDILTTDKSSEKLNIYRKFIRELQENIDGKEDQASQIINILKKADIHGIMINSILEKQQNYVSFDESHTIQYLNNSKTLNFDLSISKDVSYDDTSLLFDKILTLYNLEKYEDAFIFVKHLIRILRKNKEVNLLFISYFNYNSLLYFLKHDPFRRSSDYIDEKEIDLYDEYRKLPKKEQDACREIFNFCNSTYLYKTAFNVRQDLLKVESFVRTIESNGLVFSSDGPRYSAEHKNLIDFVLCNGLLIEYHIEFRAVNKMYVEIALKRQTQNNIIILNKYELFSCIKYFSNDELNRLFEQIFSEKKNKKFQPEEPEVRWLIDSVLPHCIEYYINRDYLYARLEQYIVNDLYLLSYIKLSDEDNNKLLLCFKEIIDKARNTFPIFESINTFFGRQFNLHKTYLDSEKTIDLLEILIEKYNRGLCNLYEHNALTHNKIYNLFGYVNYLNGSFSNIDILDSFLKKLNEKYEDITDLTYIAQHFLLSLYQISDKACKEKIKEYILKFKDFDNPDHENKFSFILSLLQLSISDDFDKIAVAIENYLKQQKESKIISSRIFVIKRQVESIQKEHSEFTDCLNLLNELIELYNLNRFTSYI